MSYATKRMWLRRWRRLWAFIGLFVFWPFRIIGWLYNMYKTRPGDFAFTMFLMIFFGGIIGAISYKGYNDIQDAKVASQELLIAESKADPCFKFNMPTRIENWKRPATVRDVRELIEACAELDAKTKAVSKQLGAFK